MFFSRPGPVDMWRSQLGSVLMEESGSAGGRGGGASKREDRPFKAVNSSLMAVKIRSLEGTMSNIGGFFG